MYDDLDPNIVIDIGRPKIDKILESVLERTSSHGVVVGVCGPVGLGERVRSAVGSVNSARCREVGGIELCEE